MTIKQRLLLFASCYLVAICLVGWVANVTVDHVMVDLAQVNQAHLARSAFSRLQTASNQFLMIPQTWLNTGNHRLQDEMKKTFPVLARALGEAERLALSQETRELMERVSDSMGSITEVADEIMALAEPRLSAERGHELLMVYEAHQEVLLGLFGRIDDVAAAEVSRAIGESEALQFKLYRFLVIVFIAVLMFTSYFVLRLTRWMAEPIDDLVAGAKKISEGHFEHRIALDRKDEFGRLSRSFDEMAGFLGDSHQRLNTKLLESETLMEVARVANSSLGVMCKALVTTKR